MKHLSFFIPFLCIIFGMSISVSFAAPSSTLSTTAPIVGTGAGENAGKILFDYLTGLPTSDRVSINAAGSLAFTGFFWIENVGWGSFGNLGVDGAKLQATVTDANIMSMTGFAWSQNAGWISFAPRNVVDTTTLANSDVFFNKTTGLFHGYAWSENLGWINMEGFMTDITAPNIPVNFKPFSTSGSKLFTLVDPSPIVPPGSSYIFNVENWDTTAVIPIASSVPSFTHDFRQVKPSGYALTITDPFGNSTTGNVQVVADIPSDTLNSINIGVAEASTYTGSFTDSRVADATAVHTMSMKLRDQYGNPVKNESTTDAVPTIIKTVNVRVAFSNNVDKKQLSSTGSLGDAIIYPLGTFGLVFGIVSNSGSDNFVHSTGDYILNISSYAPTKAGYAFTNSNDISLQKLSYEVTPAIGFSGVGEVIETHKENINPSVGTNNLRFSPALYIGSVTNSDNWSIIQGYNTNFSATLVNTTTVPLTIPKVAHILDIDSNLLISYQNPTIISGGTEICNGYMKTISTGIGSYTQSTNTPCYRPDSSNILIVPVVPIAPNSSAMDFSWKPTIILASPVTSLVNYKSEISYTNGTTNVTYPSYNRSNNSALSATGAVIALSSGSTGSGVTNQSVKILGMANSNNMFNTLSGNTINNVSSLTRVDIKNAIHKNVEIMTKGGANGIGTKYQVYIGDTTLSSWPDLGKDTIIIKGGNLIIDGNITSGTNIKGIIVLEDTAGNKGNIYIKKNVSNIAAVLFTDKSILSGDGASYYSDVSPSVQTATGQLFIEGSVISNNTIGGASMTPLKCPYNITGCTDVIAKRYDLNYFRFYKGIGATSPGAANPAVPAGSETYPFVIKYDSRLQTAPPPGFKTIQ